MSINFLKIFILFPVFLAFIFCLISIYSKSMLLYFSVDNYSIWMKRKKIKVDSLFLRNIWTIVSCILDFWHNKQFELWGFLWFIIICNLGKPWGKSGREFWFRTLCITFTREQSTAVFRSRNKCRWFNGYSTTGKRILNFNCKSWKHIDFKRSKIHAFFHILG